MVAHEFLVKVKRSMVEKGIPLDFVYREIIQISTIRDNRNEFFRLESGLCKEEKIETSTGDNEQEVSVKYIHDRVWGTPSFIKYPPAVKRSPGVKRDTKAPPVLEISLYGTVPRQTLFQMWKEGTGCAWYHVGS